MMSIKLQPLSRLALGFVACAFQTGAMAQQEPDLNALPLEQLLNLDVSTTSKIPQKISEAPSSVSVITAEDIRQRGYRTLADVLQSVPGVQVAYDRNYSYANVRGLGSPGDFNTRLLILIDGRRLNDVVFDQGALGTEFPIDLDLIERVEFVPGPGSAVYGSSAFFGVVNVITKRGAGLNATLARAGLSGAGGREARIAAGSGRAGGIDVLFGASWLDSPGRDLYFPEFDAVAHHLDYDRYRRLFAKVSFGELVAEAYFARRTKGVPTASYGQQFDDPRSRTEDEYAGAALSWHRAITPELEVYGSANVARYRYSGIYVYAPASDSASVNVDAAESRSQGAELRIIGSGLPGHKLIAGAEVLRDGRRNMVNYDTDPIVSILDVDHPKRRRAVYMQDEMRLGERLILNTGLRRDLDSEGGNTTNPRVALIYKATPQATLKALYGTAFRSANAYEHYYDVDYKPNPSLRPERIKTYELVAEYFPTDRFRAGASLFQYRLRDLLALTTDPQDGELMFSNIDVARATGIELDAQWLGADGSAVKASASLQSARDEVTGAWLPNSPRRLFKLNATRPLLGERLRASAEYRYTSRRRTVLDGEVGGFAVVNVSLLATTPGQRVEVSASVYNLTGKRYADSASEEHYDNGEPPRHLQSIAQDGRSWPVLATFRF